MYIDLHCHTLASDGRSTPEELVRKAKKIGLSYIAKTDHDNVDLTDVFLRAGKKYGVKTITGIEISSKYKGMSAHIVGLGIDYTDKDIIRYSKKCELARKKRAMAMMKILSKIGWQIKKDELDVRIITRPHLARAVLSHPQNRKRLISEFGKIPNFSEFIGAYLAKNCVGYVEKSYYMPVRPAIRMIRKAGGLAILAHPKCKTEEFSYNQKHLLDLLKLKFDGIEVYASKTTQAEINGLKKLVKKYGLLASAGSDYHGYDKEYPLGICNAEKYTKAELCKDLLAKLDMA